MYTLFLSRIQWASCADLEETERNAPLFPSPTPASVLQGRFQKRPRPCHFWHPPHPCPVWFLAAEDSYQFLLQLPFRMWVSLFQAFYFLTWQCFPMDVVPGLPLSFGPQEAASVCAKEPETSEAGGGKNTSNTTLVCLSAPFLNPQRRKKFWLVIVTKWQKWAYLQRIWKHCWLSRTVVTIWFSFPWKHGFVLAELWRLIYGSMLWMSYVQHNVCVCCTCTYSWAFP